VSTTKHYGISIDYGYDSIEIIMSDAEWRDIQAGKIVEIHVGEMHAEVVDELWPVIATFNGEYYLKLYSANLHLGWGDGDLFTGDFNDFINTLTEYAEKP
jgi:hypothetical protein